MLSGGILSGGYCPGGYCPDTTPFAPIRIPLSHPRPLRMFVPHPHPFARPYLIRTHSHAPTPSALIRTSLPHPHSFARPHFIRTHSHAPTPSTPIRTPPPHPHPFARPHHIRTHSHAPTPSALIRTPPLHPHSFARPHPIHTHSHAPTPSTPIRTPSPHPHPFARPHPIHTHSHAPTPPTPIRTPLPHPLPFARPYPTHTHSHALAPSAPIRTPPPIRTKSPSSTLSARFNPRNAYSSWWNDVLDCDSAIGSPESERLEHCDRLLMCSSDSAADIPSRSVLRKEWLFESSLRRSLNLKMEQEFHDDSTEHLWRERSLVTNYVCVCGTVGVWSRCLVLEHCGCRLSNYKIQRRMLVFISK